jgi:hypothetical protein
LLKPGFFTNDKLAELPAHGRLLFAGLWTLADREGRLPDRPKWIKGALFPYENPPVERLLGLLDTAGFIWRYQVNGERYIEVPNFSKHQHVHVNEQPSTIPAPDEHRTALPDGETNPSVTTSTSKAEAEAEAENPAPPALPFTLAWTGRYQQDNSMRRPSPIVHGELVALEREHGSDWCFRAAESKGWDKKAAYLREWIIDHKSRDGPSQPVSRAEQIARLSASGSGVSTARQDSNGVANGVSGLDRRSAAIAKLGRRDSA